MNSKLHRAIASMYHRDLLLFCKFWNVNISATKGAGNIRTYLESRANNTPMMRAVLIGQYG